MSDDETIGKSSQGTRKVVQRSQIWQNVSRGRSRAVTVEVKKRRFGGSAPSPQTVSGKEKSDSSSLSATERDLRRKALEQAENKAQEPPPKPEMRVSQPEKKEEPKEKKRIIKETKFKGVPPSQGAQRKKTPSHGKGRIKEKERRKGKLTITQALDEGGGERMRSLAAIHRARERQRQESKTDSTQDDSPVVREITIPETIRVSDLTARMAEKSADVIKTLMQLGVIATINETIDADTAELVVNEFGHKAKRIRESDVEIGLDIQDDAQSLQMRAPVVTIMGHVDHGKTSLLDALQRSDVASGEAGGITQHIGAYQITTAQGRVMTFLDTPGHAAFTEMRQRGAKVTDIAVIVVAADDGVMPQTVEAIHHARAAGVPIIIAITKMDLPDVKPDAIYDQLLQHEVITEKRRGDVLACEISVKKKETLTHLEDAIALQAELLELKANPQRRAAGIVIEAKIEHGRGPMATLLVQHGTLRKGDIIVAGQEWGKLRLMVDSYGAPQDTALPSMPIAVVGLNGVPLAGDEFSVVENEKRAKEISQYRTRSRLERSNKSVVSRTMPNFEEKESNVFAVLIKADVRGSVEAIKHGLEKMSSDQVTLKVIYGAVGEVSESDVTLAAASDAFIIAFNSRIAPKARALAEREEITCETYSIIYRVFESIEEKMTARFAPEFVTRDIGEAEIKQLFDIGKVGVIAGCMVTNGIIQKDAYARVMRGDDTVFDGGISQIKHFKENVSEVKSGSECGIALQSFTAMQAGDRIVCYVRE